MKLSYKRDMTHNYMVPDLAEILDEDDYRVHMLLENQIRGLLPCSVKKINCQSRFFYDITSRQSMEHIYGKWLMSEEDILTFLRCFYRALKEIRKYLLDADMLVLTPQAIYLDVETREPWFCYLPGYRKSITESFQEITKYFLEHLDRREEGAVLLAYGIYRKAREENYCLEEILKEALAREMQKQGNEKEWNVQRDRLRDGRAGYETFQERRPEYQEDWERRSGSKEQWETDRENRRDRGLPGQRKEKEYHAYQESAKRKREYEEPYRSSALAWDDPAGPDWEEGPQKGEKNIQKKKKKAGQGNKKRTKSGKRSGTKKSGQTFFCVCCVFAVVLAAAAAWLWGLSTAQIGGIIFLLAGLLVYGCSVSARQKKQKEKAKEKEAGSWKEAGYEDGDFEPEYEESYKEKADRRRPEEYWEERGAGRTYGYENSFKSGYAYDAKHEKNADAYRGNYFPEYETADRVSESRAVYGRKEETTGSAGRKYRPKMETRSEKRARLGDTGVLYEENAYEPTLILVSANPNSREAILLEKDCYIVGKLASESDIVLKNPSVSRIHAKIERRGGEYYLCDLNSTNGTFLNGRRLEINEGAAIHPTDEIAFAKVRYHVGKC